MESSQGLSNGLGELLRGLGWSGVLFWVTLPVSLELDRVEKGSWYVVLVVCQGGEQLSFGIVDAGLVSALCIINVCVRVFVIFLHAGGVLRFNVHIRVDGLCVDVD